jgi:integrase/recombinase XerC
VAPRTLAAYESDLRGFATWAERAGIEGPDGVDRTLLRRYVAHLATRRYARSSVARKISALRRYFGWLLRTGRVAVDPTAGLSTPRGESRLPRVLRQDEVNALLDEPPAAVEGDPVAVRLRDDAVLEVLYGSGLRVAELCGLDESSLDRARGRATVWGKGGKERAVPLSAPSVDALR